MEFHDYLRALRRHWRLLVALSILGVGSGAVAGIVSEPTYTASTKLFVAASNSGSIAELQQGNTFSQARVQSYAETATTPVVLQPVINELGLDTTAAQLEERIGANTDLNTVLLTITASDSSPVQAAAIAQGVADSLVDVVRELESTGESEGTASPIKLSVVTPAVAPSEPSAPSLKLYLFIGLLVGGSVGVCFATLRTITDTLVRGESDVRRATEFPLLGGISYEADAQTKPLLTQTPAQSPRAESFRQIRTNLQFAQVSYESRAILVTSSLPGEGKSTTATNLAISIAQAGQSVVLVDADLRRPRVDEYLGLERNAGLTTALIGRADVEDLLQPWGTDELYVLTSGQIPPNPSELLGSDAMKQLITRLEEKFDAVIIDAPPLLPVTDAAVLAQQVGGVVLVVGSSKVKLPDLQKSLANLAMVNADLLGVVMNLLPSKGPDAYAYSYYSYDSVATPAMDGAQPATRRSAKESSSDLDGRAVGVSSQNK